jgi:hypothetical protein
MKALRTGQSKATANRKSQSKSFGSTLKARAREIILALKTLGKNSSRNKLGRSLMSSSTSSKTKLMFNVMTLEALTLSRKSQLVLRTQLQGLTSP